MEEICPTCEECGTLFGVEKSNNIVLVEPPTKTTYCLENYKTRKLIRLAQIKEEWIS